MNRLRVLKRRAHKGGVSIHKMGKRYLVATGRFQGDASIPMSKRAAIQLAARWAMPSGPRQGLIEQDGTQTVVTMFPDGRCMMVERQIESADL